MSKELIPLNEDRSTNPSYWEHRYETNHRTIQFLEKQLVTLYEDQLICAKTLGILDDPGKLGYGRTLTSLDVPPKEKFLDRFMDRVSGSIKRR